MGGVVGAAVLAAAMALLVVRLRRRARRPSGPAAKAVDRSPGTAGLLQARAEGRGWQQACQHVFLHACI